MRQSSPSSPTSWQLATKCRNICVNVCSGKVQERAAQLAEVISPMPEELCVAADLRKNDACGGCSSAAGQRDIMALSQGAPSPAPHHTRRSCPPMPAAFPTWQARSPSSMRARPDGRARQDSARHQIRCFPLTAARAPAMSSLQSERRRAHQAVDAAASAAAAAEVQAVQQLASSSSPPPPPPPAR